MSELHIFGIRHHGPGCARALAAALESLEPDILLVEGPPEGEDVLHLARSPEMEPPVAILVYQPEKPDAAVFYPFATFSPEWTAIRYAAKHDVPLRLIDLPWQHRFALASAIEQQTSENELEAAPEIAPAEKTFEHRIIDDPLGVLSQLAGFDDTESWWEQVVEQSQSSDGIFSGIIEIMTELRVRTIDETATGNRPYEGLREAWMRTAIRRTIKEGHEKIAVVCGAWHSPVLDVLTENESQKTLIPPKKDDDTLLKKLPKCKVTTTWTPWTYSRLAYRSGYGAGVAVPGWYDHLWATPDRAVIRWISRAARLLRDESLDTSSANVIEAVRLADALAAMRDRPLPGLAEVNEAILTVLCHGDSTPLKLIRRRLDTGQCIGRVPAETPAVPLLRDIEREQKQLRLKVSEEIVTLDLDLRKDADRAKSRLLHRLQLLGIPWGKPQIAAVRSTGTFHEYWQLQWQVEFVVQIIEANSYGNTLELAVAGAVRAKAESVKSIPEITALIEAAIPAELPAKTIDELLVRLQNDAAVSSDISGLMLALPPLVNVMRYGNVRGTNLSQVEPVFNALFQRVLVGLVPACGSLDDDAATRRVAEIVAVQEAIDLHHNDENKTDWQRVLVAMTKDDSLHAMLRGRCCRLLYEQGVLSETELAEQIALAVTPAVEASKVAQWMQGFLQGSGQMLLQFDPLWTILNDWLCTISDGMFEELVALLRRSFAEFSGPELRMMGQKVKKLQTSSDQTKATLPKQSGVTTEELRIDLKRVEKTIPVLRQILYGNEKGET